MATRSARDNKALNARHAETLKAMLRRPENKTCADCKRNDPRWASTNLGCFMCIRCSGIHRSMGVHITRIKSIDLDTWTPEQVATVQRWGNRRANAYWEAHLRPGHMPPDHKIESFIRSKYESKRWVMAGPMPEPESLDAEGDATAPPPATVTSSEPPHRSSATLGKAPVAPPATTTINLLDAPPSSSNSVPPPTNQSARAITSTATSNPSLSGAGGGLFDLDFSPNASAVAATATAPAARKDVKKDILSLFATKSPTAYGQALPTNANIQRSTDINGINNQFSGMNMSTGVGSQTSSRNDVWAQLGTVGSVTQSDNTFKSSPAFGFGGNNNVSRLTFFS
ncbi:hypothetical protein CROQUDRAFT_54288 [Cronartium quercuum f. sp. fusiforme G11]|uniref:Arf-GAP domain-containing protein n=1 Tax=Cronartium quercuum f. sp. fusiforme G11 TaxID=708437 RepID=A0A9P6N8Q3_9BASI|nr:hypothetical protein CROQUDRAFT_54288 [Cronartium quercuum f. sp. fusiforme G11]